MSPCTEECGSSSDGAAKGKDAEGHAVPPAGAW